MADLVVTESELVEITRKVRPTAQVRALRALGIDHKVRADGTPLVLRKSLTVDISKGKVSERFAIDWEGET